MLQLKNLNHLLKRSPVFFLTSDLFNVKEAILPLGWRVSEHLWKYQIHKSQAECGIVSMQITGVLPALWV